MYVKENKKRQVAIIGNIYKVNVTYKLKNKEVRNEIRGVSTTKI